MVLLEAVLLLVTVAAPARPAAAAETIVIASRGGRGIVHPERDAAGRWRVRRDIQLGQGIRGYDQCGGRR